MKPQKEKLGEATNLFLEIRKYVVSLTQDTAEIVYLFFAMRMDIIEISHIYEIDPDKIARLLGDFMKGLKDSSNSLRRFLYNLPEVDVIHLDSETYKTKKQDVKQILNLLIKNSDTSDSAGWRVRELIGTALRLGTPYVPSGFRRKIAGDVVFISKFLNKTKKEAEMQNRKSSKDETMC